MATQKEILDAVRQMQSQVTELQRDMSAVKERLNDYPEIRKDVQELKTDYATMTVKMAGIIGAVTMVVSLFFNGLIAWFKSGAK